MTAVATAIIGSAAIGAYSSNKASKRAQESANRLADQGDAAAQLGRDQFDWYKSEYERTRPQREEEAARAGRIADSQYEGMQYAMEQAREMDARRRGIYQPLEDSYIRDAQAFDTDAKREELAGLAMADTQRAFDSADGQNFRDMAARGINPNSGAAMALRQRGTLDKALGLAGSANSARRQARAEGRAMKMDAIGLGKGVVGNQSTMMQLANQGGNSAVAAGAAGLNAAYSGAPLMQQGFGSAMTGMNTMANLYGRAGTFQNTADYWTGKRNNAIGSMMGVGLGAGADAWASLGRATSGGI